jgi:fatty-acyl-CoA synthase
MLHAGMTMAEAIEQVTSTRKDSEALVCGSDRVTYQGLFKRIEALAAGLFELGVRQGDKVACLLPPGHEYAYLFFALGRLGAVIMPFNSQMRPLGLLEALMQAEPLAVVAAIPIDKKVFKGVSSLRHIISVKPVERNGISFGDLIATGSKAQLPEFTVEPDDLLALLYTSGTTGKPKGTMHSHRGLIAPVVASIKLRELWLHKLDLKRLGQTAKALGRYRLRLLRAAGKSQTFLSTVSWHTITGLEVMLQALLMGDRLVVMPRFHPRQALELIAHERVTVLVGVPLAFQMMLGISDFDRYDTSSLLICGTGAAPCPPQLASQIRARFGCALHIGFGSTETAGGIAATSLADSDDRQISTVGRPMPGVEIKIVDEKHQSLPAGEVGELVCRSDSIMMGYYGSPEDTAEVIDEDGWYYTGDLAYLDEAGYLRIVGRLKDVIIRGGQNIYPADVEGYLVSHPKIQEAAVVGMPAQLGGESPWAFVLLEEGMEMSAQEVLDYCRAALQAYMIPSEVRFVNDFPRSETGKPQKYKLRLDYLSNSEVG